MIEDRNGFIWIGTWDGLNRFDGYDFVIYKSGAKTGKTNIGNSTINALFQDTEGLIWVGTDEGLNVFHPEKIEFSGYFQGQDINFTIGENRIFSLSEGKIGEIWVGTANGLYVFKKDIKEFKFIPFPSDKITKRQQPIRSLNHSASSDLMWVGTSIGLFSFNSSNYEYTYHSSENLKLPRLNINTLFEDSKQMLWIGSEKGLYIYDFTRDKVQFFNMINSGLESDNILSVMEDVSGNIWIGTLGGGVSVYSRESNSIIPFGNNEQLNGGLSNNYIYSLLQSANGTIWIGTWRGLNKFTPGQFRFTHILHGQGKNLLNSNMVWSFLEFSSDIVWIGTENGINILNKQNGSISNITTKSGHALKPPSNKIRAMFRDSDKKLWIGTLDAGLVCFDPMSNSNKYFFADNNTDNQSLAGNSVWSIVEDNDDKSIWVATDGGVSRIFKDGKSVHYRHEPENPHSISQDEVYWILKDKANNIWLTSFSGVDIYNRDKDNFNKFEDGNHAKLSTNRILSAFEDSRGNIWFATMGEGVSKFDPISGKMIVLTETVGLANNTVYNIIEDTKGFIWVTTNQGISRITPDNLNIWNFDIRDGVQGHEFNLGAAAILSSGEILFGGMNGCNIFHPDQLRENKYKPKVYITSYSVLNKKQKDFLKNYEKLELNWWENYFSFEFAALDFVNPKKINYAYILDGFDKEWNFVASDKRYADYTNIPPGDYVFKVKATNSDGLWSPNETEIYIKVHAPFWKTLWFKIVFAFILTFLIWYIVNSQIRKIKKRQEIERRMLDFEKHVFEMEQKILHLQMNPHFLFNALNSIQSFILNNETDNAVNYLSKFSNLMRLILQTSRSANVVLSDEIKLLRFYLEIESLRFNHIFSFNIIVDSEIDEEFTAIPSHMVQPLVENSIKHGLIHKEGNGVVTVTFSQHDEYIEVIVEDNGIGRKKAMEIQSRNKLNISNQGISISKERLNLFNKQRNSGIFELNYFDITSDDGSVTGTRAILKVPFIDV